jgi:hypothetical protein
VRARGPDTDPEQIEQADEAVCVFLHCHPSRFGSSVRLGLPCSGARRTAASDVRHWASGVERQTSDVGQGYALSPIAMKFGVMRSTPRKAPTCRDVSLHARLTALGSQA